MRVEVKVVLADEGGSRPGGGTPVRIELRDTSMVDGPSTVVAAAECELDEGGDAATAVLDVDDGAFTPQGDLTLWARCASSGRERVAVGDWITMESWPVRRSDVDRGEPIEVRLRPVR